MPAPGKIRGIAYLILTIVILFLGINYESLFYGISQLRGQVHILMNTQSIVEIMKSESFPDSLKTRLGQVREIKTFARDYLGLKGDGNYSTVYDQKGQDILWIVTACPPYKLEAYEWKFPLFGSFPYKGYFDLEKAFKEEERMKKLGYDTNVRRVSGWSTLGFFNDPILSNMLYRDEGDLANTIIHELTHATVFIKNEVDLNENLATFIGDFGALKYLEKKYSAEDERVRQYKSELNQEKVFTQYVIRGANSLDSLYQQMEDMDAEAKEKAKNRFISNWVINIDTVLLPSYRSFRSRSLNELPDNTFYMSYLRYNVMQNSFEAEFLSDPNRDLNAYVETLIRRYQRNWYDF